MLDVLSQSLRRWSSRPLVALAIVGTMACGIGLATAIYSLLENLLWRPSSSFAVAERVVVVQHEIDPAKVQGGVRFQPVALEDFRLLRSEIRSFSQVAATQVIRVLWRGEEETRRLDGEMVSAGYFELSGVPLLLGRGFSAEEDEVPDGAPVAVLSHAFWREQFGGDEGVLGRRIRLNDHDFTVVGVAAPGFVGSNRLNPADLWVPLMMYPRVFVAPQVVARRDGRFLRVFGRLAEGRGIDAARAELDGLAGRLAAELPASHGHLSFLARPLVGGPPSGFQQGLAKGGGLLLAIVLALLLIGGANIANLLLVRARARRGEMALRLALGAGRGRLARAELGDALLLTLAGAVLGLGVGWLFRGVLWALRPPYLDPQIVASGFSLSAFAFAVGTALLIGSLFTLAPIASLRRVELASLMRGEAAAAPARSRLAAWLGRQSLLIGQVALATGVIGVAGIFVLHLLESRRIDPGFATRDLVLASFDLQIDGMTPERVDAFRRELAERARALPGASAVGVAENRVLGGFRLWRTVSPVGGEAPPSTVGSGSIDAEFHRAAGIALLAGREFAPADAGGAPVAIVNRALARQLFGDANAAVGARMTVDDPPATFEVIGVVGDTAVMALGEEPKPFLYLPIDRFPSRRFTVHIRSAEPHRTLAELRPAIAQIDPGVPIESLATVDQALGEALWMERLSAALLAALGGVGLLLAGLGIYSVGAAETESRRREIGVRLAIGASRGRVIGEILRRGLISVAVGIAGGLALCFASSRFVGSLLYDAGDIGLPLAVSVTLLLATVGLLAHLLPAYRAARVDPARTLREG